LNKPIEPIWVVSQKFHCRKSSSALNKLTCDCCSKWIEKAFLSCEE
jgi:hypothetical protein